MKVTKLRIGGTLLTIALMGSLVGALAAGAFSGGGEEGRIGQLSGHQEEITQDGEVTAVEYEHAIADALDCAARQGLEILRAPEVGLDGVTLEYNYGTEDKALVDTYLATFDKCYLEHAYVVDVLFQTSVEVETLREENLAALEACTGTSLDEIRRGEIEENKLDVCRELSGTVETATIDPGLLTELITQ